MGTRLGNFRKNNTEIPVLELKKYVDAAISNYQSLISLNHWIFCETNSRN
jgi:hypothetical protein